MSRPYENKRGRLIDTPFGEVPIEEKLWESEDGKSWQWIQSINPEFDETVSNGNALKYFLEQYSVALALSQEGYEIVEQVDSEHFLWMKSVDSS
jgi:hypothetical protein